MLIVERKRAIDALRRTAPFWAFTLAWLAVHPTLHARLLSGLPMTAEVEHRPPPLAILAKTILSTLNLDVFPRPQELDWGTVLRVLASTAVLAAGVAIATRARASVDPRENPGESSAALWRIAVAWTAIGWFPLLLPSIGWHAYYGCVGTMGAWLVFAQWLEHRRTVAIVVIVCLGLLRGAQANTLSWDWGNESYQQRAGSILSAIRDDLQRQHPTLPPHSRVYFTFLPNNIGLIAGRRPALRLWHSATTLDGGLHRACGPRAPLSPPGEDLSFASIPPLAWSRSNLGRRTSGAA